MAAGVLFSTAAFAQPFELLEPKPPEVRADKNLNPVSAAIPTAKIPAATAEDGRIRRSVKAAQDSWPPHGRAELHSFDFPANPAVDKWVAYYSDPSRRSYVASVMERARLFRKTIMSKLEEQGLPSELFYLPFIESEYTVTAVSRSGAGGVPQPRR